VMPKVDGAAEPDAVVIEGEQKPMYVEVESGKNREAKWQHQVELQGFVAVCTVTILQQERIVGEVKNLGLPGRATSLQRLMSDKEGVEGLWAEEWNK